MGRFFSARPMQCGIADVEAGDGVTAIQLRLAPYDGALVGVMQDEVVGVGPDAVSKGDGVVRRVDYAVYRHDVNCCSGLLEGVIMEDAFRFEVLSDA